MYTLKRLTTLFVVCRHTYKCLLGRFYAHCVRSPKSNSSNYRQPVVDRYNTYIERGQRFLKGIPFSDLKVFKCLSHTLKGPLQVHFANSSAIRYAQLFPLNHQVEVYCNRGTSGIDGSTATAIGAAVAQQLPTVLVTGDLSFFYDINGLWNNYIPKNFKIILINNAGGGIFRILPGEKTPQNTTPILKPFTNATPSTLLRPSVSAITNCKHGEV